MKALSIVSPGGTKIASGLKTLEVRRWAPRILPLENLLIVENHQYLRKDSDEDQDGRAVAIVNVSSVRPFLEEDVPAACGSYFEEGWLAWELTDIRPIASHAKVLAARGIYEVDFEAGVIV